MYALLRIIRRLHFEAATSNGGYVLINNYESGGIDAAKYYFGQTTTHKAELVIDVVKPFHCSVESTCTDSMLDRGPAVTKSVSSRNRSHPEHIEGGREGGREGRREGGREEGKKEEPEGRKMGETQGRKEMARHQAEEDVILFKLYTNLSKLAVLV